MTVWSVSQFPLAAYMQRLDQPESFTTLACHIYVQTDECGKSTTVDLAAVHMTCERLGFQFPDFNRGLSVKGDDGSGAELRITCKLLKALGFLVSTWCHENDSVRTGTCKLRELKGIGLDFETQDLNQFRPVRWNK